MRLLHGGQAAGGPPEQQQQQQQQQASPSIAALLQQPSAPPAGQSSLSQPAPSAQAIMQALAGASQQGLTAHSLFAPSAQTGPSLLQQQAVWQQLQAQPEQPLGPPPSQQQPPPPRQQHPSPPPLQQQQQLAQLAALLLQRPGFPPQ
jgi:hypothetical protein